jgi:hypothetical protein
MRFRQKSKRRKVMPINNVVAGRQKRAVPPCDSPLV